MPESAHHPGGGGLARGGALEAGASAQALDLSVVAPAHNEQDNLADLVGQIASALSGPALRGLAWEVIIVDDGSTDRTRAMASSLMRDRAWLRCVHMTGTPPGKGNGQSAAFHAGFRAARGALIATLDADLQNDPADLPEMLALLASTGADMVQGDRSHARRDNAVRRVGSAIGRWARGLILGDSVRDTGCSLRVMKRAVALALPLEFRGMHRFIPITAIRLGYRVVEMQVRHRPRIKGETKYGLGITQRALPGLIDCFAVRWMASRRRPTGAAEVAAPVGQNAGHASGLGAVIAGHEGASGNGGGVAGGVQTPTGRVMVPMTPVAPMTPSTRAGTHG